MALREIATSLTLFAMTIVVEIATSLTLARNDDIYNPSFRGLG